MFTEVNGLPLHVLVVHAVVVLVPLLALISVAYGVLPWWRSRLDWAVAGLAVVTPIATFFAKESGEAFEEVQRQRGLGGDFLRKIEEHAEYGDTLFWFTIGLAVAALLLLLVTSNLPRVRGLPRWLAPVLTGVVVVLAAFALIYVYLTGDSGAQVVWGGTL